jgi:hypothetical protein
MKSRRIMSPDPIFNGKPPKSVGEIRHFLKAIMIANPPRPTGPYLQGLPPQERKTIVLAADKALTWHRIEAHNRWGDIRDESSRERLPVTVLSASQFSPLLERGRTCGALAGILLGGNLAAAFPVARPESTLLALACLALIPVGCIVGDSIAKLYLCLRGPRIVDCEVDAAKQAPNS